MLRQSLALYTVFPPQIAFFPDTQLPAHLFPLLSGHMKIVLLDLYERAARSSWPASLNKRPGPLEPRPG